MPKFNKAMWENIFRKRTTLSFDFFLFALIIFLAVIGLAVSFWMRTYQEELKKKQDQLPVETSRIESVLSDSLNSVAQYAEFVGEKIVHHGDAQDFNYIASLIGGKFGRHPQENNFYFTTDFDWVTPDKLLRVSSKVGILSQPYIMSGRNYLNRTPESPWMLQLDTSRIGSLSKKWIIPAGMGITDEKGRFLGSIALGFLVDGLMNKIAQIEGNTDVHYLILGDDLKLVLDSREHNFSGRSPQLSINSSNMNNLQKDGNSYFKEPIVYKNVQYSYAKKVSGYPYIILVGYEDGMGPALFNKMVLSRTLELFAIAIVALLMLYFMRYRFIKPVSHLARLAVHIAKGKEVSVPKSSISEIAILGQELKKISTYIQNERQIREELTAKTKELEAANIKAIAARDAAIKADSAKSEFLANMSHELRTPINAVIGLINILLMHNIPPERQKEYLETMRMSAQHLVQLINDLLDIAKLEAQEVILEKIPFDLAEVISEVININNIKAQEKNIDLSFQGNCPAAERFIGDPLRLKQILINLVGNAIKFTEKGRVVVKLDMQNDIFGLKDIKIVIEDTGVGIPDDKLKMIFNKFSQGDTSITRKYGGTGLGLSICKTLIETMGGTILVESQLGKGSRFIIQFRIPFFIENRIGANRDGKTPGLNVIVSNNKIHKNSNFRILLVEDNKENLLVSGSFLEYFGFPYEVARTGKEALDKLRQDNFSLVLMDVQMPEMDGLMATRLIREREKIEGLPRLPIIGVTAFALAGDRTNCLEAGMDEYIGKPFDPTEFLSLLQRFNAGNGLFPSLAIA